MLSPFNLMLLTALVAISITVVLKVDRAPNSMHLVVVTSPPLEAVRALRQTADNPPTSTNEGLDFERCAALHNAIVEHAWISAGNDLAAMPKDTVWSLDSSQENLDEMERSIGPSLREFLKRALVTSNQHYFFDFLGGLTGHGSLWEFVDPFEEARVGLYWTGSDFSLTLTGITYVNART